jgi:hypothetical protein
MPFFFLRVLKVLKFGVDPWIVSISVFGEVGLGFLVWKPLLMPAL